MNNFGYILNDDRNGVIVLWETGCLSPLTVKQLNHEDISLRLTMSRLLGFML